MASRIKFDPAKHPRGPVGRFVTTGGPQFSGNAMPPRLRAAQEQARDQLSEADMSLSSEMDDAYRRGSLWAGAPITGMSSAHRAEAADYAEQSFINFRLRDGSANPEHVRLMDEVVESNQLTQDTTVYRGVDVNLLADAQPGDQVFDRGYSSTSIDPRVSRRFGDDIMEIELPAGTPVAPMDAIDRMNQNDKELLVGRGAVFEIDDIEWRGEKGEFGDPIRVLRARLVGYVEG